MTLKEDSAWGLQIKISISSSTVTQQAWAIWNYEKINNDKGGGKEGVDTGQGTEAWNIKKHIKLWLTSDFTKCFTETVFTNF